MKVSINKRLRWINIKINFKEVFVRSIKINIEGEKTEYWCAIIVVDYDSCFRCESVMMDFSPIFLMDAWEPECLEGVKISFIFNDRKAFDKFLNHVNRAPINSEMSVVYIDTDEQSFVEEVYINTCR